MRLSSSFTLDACAKVKPVRAVSIDSGNDVETPLTVELKTWPVCVCLIINKNLKESSSSLVSRRRKEGTDADAGGSGS